MPASTRFHALSTAIAEKKHDLSNDTHKIALSGGEPSASADAVLADLPDQVALTNLVSDTIAVFSHDTVAGVYTLVLTDLVLEASGGDVGPFRYVSIYNDTATNKDLLVYFDIGTSTTITDGSTFTLDFDPTEGILDIS